MIRFFFTLLSEDEDLYLTTLEFLILLLSMVRLVLDFASAEGLLNLIQMGAISFLLCVKNVIGISSNLNKYTKIVRY